MRTALFIVQPSTVTVRAVEPRDAASELCRYQQAPVPAIGTHQLEPGVYLITSSAPLAIDGVQGELQAQRNDKDEWPSPKLTVVALEPGATAASLREFLSVAKDLSPDA
jgi:hypothetical protein